MNTASESIFEGSDQAQSSTRHDVPCLSVRTGNETKRGPCISCAFQIELDLSEWPGRRRQFDLDLAWV